MKPPQSFKNASKHLTQGLLFILFFASLLWIWIFVLNKLQNIEIVIIDAGIEQPDLLLKGLKRNANIHYISAEDNGIEQLSRILQQYQNIASLHLISHGEDGLLFLGNQKIDQATLIKSEKNLSQWHQAFRGQQGLLFIYGCEVAKSEYGESFVETLSQLSRLSVYASNNLTGKASLSGDSQFEFQVTYP